MDHLTKTELREKFGTAANYSVLGGDVGSCFLICQHNQTCPGMLAFSGMIGLYFWRKGQDSPEDTLLGGRSMSVIPITASIIGDQY